MTTLRGDRHDDHAATLNGTANPNGATTTGWFRYSTTNPGTCNDTFGTRAPASGGTALGRQRAAVPFSQPLTGLSPGTTYYFCAIASELGGHGVRRGALVHHAAPPTVTTHRATLLDAAPPRRSTATANPNGATATGWFRYGTDQPGHLQRHLRHARSGERRHRRSAAAPAAVAYIAAGSRGLVAGHDLLLLRDRDERASGTSCGRSLLVHDVRRAVGDDARRDLG